MGSLWSAGKCAATLVTLSFRRGNGFDAGVQSPIGQLNKPCFVAFACVYLGMPLTEDEMIALRPIWKRAKAAALKVLKECKTPEEREYVAFCFQGFANDEYEKADHALRKKERADRKASQAPA
jgi:hypothetical protein